MSKLDEVMGRARVIMKEAEEFAGVNMLTAPISSRLINDIARSLRDVMSLQFPETQGLEPIDFGPNDDDRVKDFFEKVFLVEYESNRNVVEFGIDASLNTANYCADQAAKIYRAWLKEQSNGNA